MRNMQCDVEFEYQISTCLRAEEYLAETWLQCSVSGPSGCILTSNIQSAGIQVQESQRHPICLKLRYFRNIQMCYTLTCFMSVPLDGTVYVT
jgi:hypothetical protein